MTPTPDSTTTVTVYGWELHYTGPSRTDRGSDKFYRVLIIDPLTLINHGRRGTDGQFVAHSCRSASAARHKAGELTNAKTIKGYTVTRDMTAFTMPETAVTDLVTLSPGMHRVGRDMCAAVIARFKEQANAQGRAASGASA